MLLQQLIGLQTNQQMNQIFFQQSNETKPVSQIRQRCIKKIRIKLETLYKYQRSLSDTALGPLACPT